MFSFTHISDVQVILRKYIWIEKRHIGTYLACTEPATSSTGGGRFNHWAITTVYSKAAIEATDFILILLLYTVKIKAIKITE